MGQEPLVEEKIAAGVDFIRELSKQTSVKAACWIKPADASGWLLHIASDAYSTGDIRHAYGQVIDIMRRDPSVLSPLEITLLPGKHPIVDAIQDLYKKHPAPAPAWFMGSYFGGMSVEGVYVYPPSKLNPRQAKKVKTGS
jgi:hypothetical protein